MWEVCWKAGISALGGIDHVNPFRCEKQMKEPPMFPHSTAATGRGCTFISGVNAFILSDARLVFTETQRNALSLGQAIR